MNDLQIKEHPVEPIKKGNYDVVATMSMAIEMRGNSLLSFPTEKPGEHPRLRSLSLPFDVFDGEEIDLIHHKLEQAARNAVNLKQLAFEESIRRWRAEEDAVEALQKDKAFEYLYTEEKSRRKELEDSLSTQIQEIEKLKNQHNGLLTELQLIENQKRALENHLAESCHLEEELETKIIQAVKLLIIFKEKRDELQREHDTATTEAHKLKKLLKEDCSPRFFEFSFLDIMEATQNFDLSWKIHEGRSGVAYRGNLRRSKVAIKMLSLSNFESNQDFLYQVEVLSRVRHPHLVTLMGTCSESRCLIYEYLDNGSLEDHLHYKTRTSVLPWKFRIRIAEEICSALVFLHTNSSSLVHGNLTTTNILLDANFVSKIADFGTSLLLTKNRNPLTDLKLVGESVDEVSAYMDPNYIENGELTPECDVYSYGVILLRLLTGRPASSILKDVEFSLQSGTLDMMLDSSAGKWPFEQTSKLAYLALRCCDMQRLNRPDLVSEVWTAIHLMRDLCNSAHSSPTLGCLAPKRQDRIPAHFICPIFQEMMKDPHVAADGYTYEGDAIKEWLNGGHKTSPMTNLPLEHCDLLQNNALYYAIQEWQHQS